jgi:hypothetical protein
LAANGFGGTFSVAAMGAVEVVTVEGDAASLTVAGQVFKVSAADTPSFRQGDYVVAGATEPGAEAVVYHVGIPYVPGISTVRVKAAVAGADVVKGTVTAGALTVDYTPHLSFDPTLAPSIGDTVQAAGTQPLLGGALVVRPSGDGISLAVGSASPERANRR